MLKAYQRDNPMKRRSASKRSRKTAQSVDPKRSSPAAVKRASIFRNGRDQAVRLPQKLRLAENVTEVHIDKQGDNLLLSRVRPDWPAFFALDVSVPKDFLDHRDDAPPEARDPL
jgi:antitoxin VapB